MGIVFVGSDFRDLIPCELGTSVQFARSRLNFWWGFTASRHPLLRIEGRCT